MSFCPSLITDFLLRSLAQRRVLVEIENLEAIPLKVSPRPTIYVVITGLSSCGAIAYTVSPASSSLTPNAVTTSSLTKDASLEFAIREFAESAMRLPARGIKTMRNRRF